MITPAALITQSLRNSGVCAASGAATPAAVAELGRVVVVGGPLVAGLDDVGVTLEHLKEIEEFEAAYRQRMPWRASRM